MLGTHTAATKFRDAIKESDKRLARYRKVREQFLRHYAGPHYGQLGEEGRLSTDNPLPLNTVFSTAATFLPHLVFRNPKTYVTVEKGELYSQAQSLALALDHLMDEIAFVDTMRSVVTDSFFSAGIIRVGLGPGKVVEDFEEPSGYLHDVGQPYADAVDLDDYIVDPNARCREQAAFEGNRYRLPLEYVQESGLYEHADTLRVESDKRKQDLVAAISAGDLNPERLNEFTEYVDLLDLWLPGENVIVTMPADGFGPDVFLREIDWEGPERGPYEMLGYHWLPSNVLPIAPVMTWFDLHAMLNIMARKAGRQAERQKTVGLYQPIAADDAAKIQSASDGEMVAVKDVNTVKEMSFGGQQDKVMQQLAYLENAASKMAGNTDLIGGMSADSGTATQDQMLMQGANARIDDMRAQVQMFTKRVMRKLAWYLWTDPLIELPLVKREMGVELDYTFSAEELEGDFLDYNIDIEPQSMQHRSPQDQYQKKMELISGPLMQMAQLGVAVGQALNPAKILESLGKDLDIPDADEWFQPAPPQGPEAMPDAAMGADQGATTVNAGGGAGGTPSPQPSSPDTAAAAPAA